MPSYKNDKKTKNKWYCSFYYTDIQGNNRKKKKEGFPTKREADEWEREFLNSVEYSPEIPFKALYDNYMEDMSHRLKEYSMYSKKVVFEKHITPFFNDMLIKDITPVVVRKWQNKIMNTINEKSGTTYSQVHLKGINVQLSAIMNYAVKFYNLKENPVHKAGTMGSTESDEMKIWSLEEFRLFNSFYEDNKLIHLGFNLLYWSGMRLGELLALTWNDVDFNTQMINIDKSFQRLNGRDLITPPKTEKSIRKILVNKSVIDELQELKNKIYKPNDNDRIIPYTKSAFSKAIVKGIKLSGLEKIRIHDLRHSHASLLIHHGVDIVVISKRLGHENITTTLDTYSHLYPNQEYKLLNLMEQIENDTN